jgi:hypothetical protein
MLDSKIDEELGWTKFQFYKWIPMEIRIQSVKDENWQKIRESMLKTTQEFKFETLQNWLEKNKFSKKSKVQTQHYMQALRRSGLIE